MILAPLLSAPARDDEDPLSTAAERLPLAWPRCGQPTSVEVASPEGVRPFGLTMKTTGPSPDGTGNTGNEEWTPDFMSDEPDELV